jgi:hypothetical protein
LNVGEGCAELKFFGARAAPESGWERPGPTSSALARLPRTVAGRSADPDALTANPHDERQSNGAEGADVVNVNGTRCKDDHDQRDKTSGERQCGGSYPEHWGLSGACEWSLLQQVTMPFWNACGFWFLPSRMADDAIASDSQ